MNKEKNLQLRELFKNSIEQYTNNYKDQFDIIIDDTNKNGTFCSYELESMYHIWLLGRLSLKEQAIKSVETYQVSTGNSCAGEIACEMTMQNLKEIRDEIKDL